MYMVRLIYVSRMTEDCDMSALQEILKLSRKNNKAKDITGVLCYDPSFFLQCLEGPRTAVNILYSEIQNDKRHTDVTLLEYADVEEREFADWSMAFLKSSELDKEIVQKYTIGKKFDTFKLNCNQARTFLLEIVEKHHESLVGH